VVKQNTNGKSAVRHDRSIVPYGSFGFLVKAFHRLKPVAKGIPPLARL
jgi:hypothetical protein